MNIVNSIVLCFAFVFLFNCKDKAQENSLQSELNVNQQNFDEILKCSEYSYDENYFLTADYGCIYNQKNNKYGNVIIYLVPLKKMNIKDDQIAVENARVNKLSVYELKKEFKIILFLIDYKYLNYNKSGDPLYYQKSEYQEKAYTFDEVKNTWVLIDSINVATEKEDEREQIWRENIVSQWYNVKDEGENLSKVIQLYEANNFSLIKKQVCDLNMDNLQDFILIFANNREYNSADTKTKIAPIVVLINKGNERFTKYENQFIYPNNFNDLYKNLVVKDSFFTIELSNEDPNNYNLEKYITFKYNSDNIMLHRYSALTYWSDGREDKVNYSVRNFGSIQFSDFNSNTFLDKVNIN